MACETLGLTRAQLKTVDERNLFQKIFGYCPHCRHWFRRGVKCRRQNTAYQDEASNFIAVCPVCFEEIQANWEEMWKDYWSSCH